MHKKSWFDIYNIYIELELIKTSSRVHISSTQQAKAGQPPGKNFIAEWGHPGATKPTPTGRKDAHTATDGKK